MAFVPQTYAQEAKNTPEAVPAWIKSALPNAQKVGQGRMRFMLWNVYDARLYNAKGQWTHNSLQEPLALSLSYLRHLSGQDIADRSIQEMRGLGINNEVQLASWHRALRAIFPDVDNTTVLTGIRDEAGITRFFRHGEQIGVIEDEAFATAFFGIWLDEKTSAPDLRLKLIGAMPP